MVQRGDYSLAPGTSAGVAAKNVLRNDTDKRIKIPSIGWGGWRGNPSDRPPPPFRESVAEPIRAGDLTCSNRVRIHSCATVSDSHRLRRWLTVLTYNAIVCFL